MKKFLEGVLEWKTGASLFFTGSVILYAIITLIRGENQIPIAVIASILIISFIGTFLQFLAFSDRIIKKMRYTIRMIIFIIPFFALLAVNAYFFRWFPMGSTYWLTFTLIFLVVFAGMVAGFEIYYRVTGRKYDGLLGQYRKQKELNKK